jgi:hypothetical protein
MPGILDVNIPDYDFGFEFSYSSWNSETRLTLVNVPWNSDYRDIVRFSSQSQLDGWINRQPNLMLPNASLQKFQQDVTIDTPLNRAMKYNYLRADNGPGAVGDDKRTYYYFINDIDFVAGNTTRLSLQLDVWQTFGYEVMFGNSYIERGHIGIANANAFNNYGRDFLTTPEGLDIGGDYRIVHIESEQIINPDAGLGDVDNDFDILVCSTLNLAADPGTVDDPSIRSATGAVFNKIPSGANFYLFKSAQNFLTFMQAFSPKPWVTQSIISITVIPSMTRYNPEYNYGANLGSGGVEFYDASNSPSELFELNNGLSGAWRAQPWIASVLGAKYAGLLKFLTFPYMMIELTAWNGSPVVLRPELWNDNDATIRESVALMPPGQRIALIPRAYNKDSATGTMSGYDDGGEHLDSAKFIDSFVQVPVVNNMAIAFLASNKNGLAFSRQNASWEQQKALMGAQAGVDVAGAQIRNTGVQNAAQNTADTENAALGALTNQQNSQWSAIAGMTNPLSALGGGADIHNAINSGNASIQQTQNMIQGRSAGALSDIKTQASIRDTNAEYARSAAKGDYQNSIAGIQARIQDAQLTQPSTSGQFGGDAFNLVNGQFGYSLRWKMLDKASLQRIGNYWLRYGYAVDMFAPIPADFQCMSKFTYWKLKETYISQGAFPEKFKQTIRGIFENGVTVWRQPEYIGHFDDNTPMGSVTL